MELDHQKNLNIKIGMIVILTIIQLNLHPINLILMFTTLVLVYFEDKSSKKNPQSKLNLERIKWFIGILHRNFNSLGIDDSFYIQRLLNLAKNLKGHYLLKELGNKGRELEVNLTLPDIEESERVIHELETKNSVYMTGILTVPLLYLLLSIFYVNSAYLSFLILISIHKLFKILTYQFRNPYKLQSWSEYTKLVLNNNNQIVNFPINGYFVFDNIYLNPSAIELGLNPEIDQLTSVQEIFFYLHQILLMISTDLREKLMGDFIFQIREIPSKEIKHEQHWKALKMQFFVISIISIFFNLIILILFKITSHFISTIENQSLSQLLPIIEISEFEVFCIFVLLFQLLSEISMTYLNKNETTYYKSILMILLGLTFSAQFIIFEVLMFKD